MEHSTLHQRTMGKVGRRLIPFMILMFFVNFLDRVNIGYAALQMNQDLHLTPEIYGFAAGILFIGYTAFEIPSNLMLSKVGARLWLSRIMITWGIVATLMAFVFDKYSLYTMRALLGIAEAGFFPGIMLYLIRWFPQEERAKAITLFMLGNPISIILGAPISTAILSYFQNVGGLAGWQWLFVIQGIPGVILGVMTLWVLTETPMQAKWLEKDEREYLRDKLDAEHQSKLHQNAHLAKASAAFTSGATWVLAFSKFCVLLAFFGITLWLPQIVSSMGKLSTLEVGLVSAIPYAFSAVVSIVIGRHSDKTGERTFHIAIPAFLGAVGFVVAGLTGNPYVALAALCVAATGLWVSNTLFWTLPASILSGASAAAGLALINTVGNLGGFFGPLLTGWVRGTTHSYAWALVALGGFLALSGIVVILVSRLIPPSTPKMATA